MTKPKTRTRTKPGPKPTGVPCLGLAAALERSSLTRTAAAAKAGLSRTQIVNWVRNGHAPRADLEALVAVLGTTVDAVADAGAVPNPLQDALSRLDDAEARLQEAEAAVREARASVARLQNAR